MNVYGPGWGMNYFYKENMSEKEEQNFYLYQWTNLVNGKIYIGQTNNPEQRQAQYKSAVKRGHNEMVITRALMKYGIEKFKFEVLVEVGSQEKLDQLEYDLIEQLGARKPEIGYNVAMGGGKTIHTPEIREKMSESLKKHYETNFNWNKGGTLTEEWKENISKSSMGKPGTNLGKKFSEEHKSKISQSQQGSERIKSRRFTVEDELNICKWYQNGQSTREIGKMFINKNGKVTNTNVISAVLVRNNIELRNTGNVQKAAAACRKFDDETENKICEEFGKKKSFRQLGRDFGCLPGTIKNILVRLGIIKRYKDL